MREQCTLNGVTRRACVLSSVCLFTAPMLALPVRPKITVIDVGSHLPDARRFAA